MRTVNSWFSDSIERYKKLTAETAELKENVLTLPLAEILQRCASIKKLQESFVDREEKLHEIMAFIGSDVLENPLVGEYQNALDLAIKEMDLLTEKTRLRKNLLMQEIGRVQASKKGISEYRTGINKYDNAVQQGNLY